MKGVTLLETAGDHSVAIAQLSLDSREVAAGTAFFALRGTAVDGHTFITKAVDLGATAIVCEELPTERKAGVAYAQVKDSSIALGIAASNFYDNPSATLKLVAVTGTNGKTSTVTMCYNLFRELGYKVGLLSTVRNIVDTAEIPSTHTTPDAIKLNALLADMVDAGCEFAFMEASSHAIVQHRIAGLQLTGAVFSNITHDHLDYHGTFDNYIAAKKKLFDDLAASAFALTNIDEKRGRVMMQNTKAKVYTYSLSRIADYKGRIVENSFSGLIMDVDGVEMHTRLIGEFNAYNLMAVYGIAMLLGVDKLEALSGISNLASAEGRFDYVVSFKEKVVGIVDYAHTPDALKKVLSTIQAIRTGNEQVITVVGCGGNRDKEKRPIMARIACELSNRVILTSDNPRNEDPAEILREMQAGVTPVFATRVLTIQDRREAIRTACALAQPTDIVLVAGKGHEKYQDVAGVKHPFDDKKILAETLKELDK